MATRRCSECGASLTGEALARKTCSNKCRSARSRRLQRQKKEANAASQLPDHLKEVTQSTQDHEAIKEVVRDELAPVVRDAITEDVLRSIEKLVNLTPQVVSAIEEDLASEDPQIRQRAYTLVTKYTIGHAAIVRPPEEQEGKTLVVNFGLPRPGDAVAHVESDIELESQEIKQCDMCGEDKGVGSFVAGSNRCQQCYKEQQAVVRKMLEEPSGN